MNTTEQFSTERVRQAVRDYASKSSLHRLAKESGVDWASLSRFIAGKGISIESLEKLWPHLWPTPAPVLASPTPSQPPEAA